MYTLIIHTVPYISRLTEKMHVCYAETKEEAVEKGKKYILQDIADREEVEVVDRLEEEKTVTFVFHYGSAAMCLSKTQEKKQEKKEK